MRVVRVSTLAANQVGQRRRSLSKHRERRSGHGCDGETEQDFHRFCTSDQSNAVVEQRRVRLRPRSRKEERGDRFLTKLVPRADPTGRRSAVPTLRGGPPLPLSPGRCVTQALSRYRRCSLRASSPSAPPTESRTPHTSTHASPNAPDASPNKPARSRRTDSCLDARATCSLVTPTAMRPLGKPSMAVHDRFDFVSSPHTSTMVSIGNGSRHTSPRRLRVHRREAGHKLVTSSKFGLKPLQSGPSHEPIVRGPFKVTSPSAGSRSFATVADLPRGPIPPTARRWDSREALRVAWSDSDSKCDGSVGPDAAAWIKTHGELAARRFRGVQLTRPWPGRDFHGADLSTSDLTGCSLSKYDLRWCRHAFHHVGQRACASNDLRRANLARANLCDASLAAVDLRREPERRQPARNQARCRSEPRWLDGVNLEHAVLDGADLRGCTFHADTIWPSSFDPEHAGAIRV